MGSLGHCTGQLAPSLLAMQSNQNLERFCLSPCGRVGISESIPGGPVINTHVYTVYMYVTQEKPINRG